MCSWTACDSHCGRFDRLDDEVVSPSRSNSKSWTSSDDASGIAFGGGAPDPPTNFLFDENPRDGVISDPSNIPVSLLSLLPLSRSCDLLLGLLDLEFFDESSMMDSLESELLRILDPGSLQVLLHHHHDDDEPRSPHQRADNSAPPSSLFSHMLPGSLKEMVRSK